MIEYSVNSGVDPFTTYIFGFRDVTHLTDSQRENQQFKVQHNAPFFWADQYDDVLNPNELRVQLTNLVREKTGIQKF